MDPVAFGVLGNSKHAREKVIPAMKNGQHTTIKALASRNPDTARETVDELEIPTLYGSYEELIEDPEIEAVYNPLPNHLHVPWSKKSARAGKHVLCEKPIAMSAGEARELVDVRDETNRHIQEAFMVLHNPQWRKTREWVREGRIGELQTMQWSFGYYNVNPNDVRNQDDIGGGGVYDIGCYCITTSRYIFEEEPNRVMALIEHDPKFGIDYLTSAILDFPSGQASFFVSTQVVDCQRAQIVGTDARLEVEVPCNAPNDRPNRIYVDDGSGRGRVSEEVEEMSVVDQFTVQADNFARTIRGDKEQTIPLEYSVDNMEVIDAIFESGTKEEWVDVG